MMPVISLIDMASFLLVVYDFVWSLVDLFWSFFTAVRISSSAIEYVRRRYFKLKTPQTVLLAAVRRVAAAR